MTLSELKSQAANLEPQEQRELKAFLEELEADAWDAQIEADVKAGRLDHLIERVRANARAVKSIPIGASLEESRPKSVASK